MAMNGETTLSTIPRVRQLALPTRKDGPTHVDWDAVHRMVLESSARLTWGEEASEEFVAQAWARRAAKLAQTLEDEEAGERAEIVVIRLGRELYGLETDYVFDIRPLEKLTRVPRVPRWVAGVVNLRGRVVSALDLPVFLNLPEPEGGRQSEQQYLVVVETPGMEIAIVVDEVLAIENLPLGKILEATTTVRGIRPDYLRGIMVGSEDNHSREHTNGNDPAGGNTPSNGKHGNSSLPRINPTLLVILNLQVLLADPRLIIHEDIL